MSKPDSSSQVKPARPVVVTAAIIRDGDRLLIAQRKADSKIEANKWEFPGGKVEFGEHPEECLRREIQEELGIEIGVGALYDVVSHVYRDAKNVSHIILLCYLCRYVSGEVQLLDVADAKWITLDKLDDFEFAIADRPVIAKLKQTPV